MIEGMTSWTGGLPTWPEVSDIAGRVDDDDNVHAVLLTGSFAHEMATDACDLDLRVVLERPDEAWRTGQYGRVDLRVDDRRFFARAPGHPSTWWDRYRIARGRILLDRTDGAFTRDLGAWGRLTPAERLDAIDYYLDPYLTYSQRSLHEAQVGEASAARWDALEAMPWALRLVFAVHWRVRPINRYLAWELDRHPLGEPGWDSAWLLEIVDAALRDGSVAAQRELFGRLEPALREAGFGGALSGYPTALTYLHG